jgi:catechol 2,3-dioxygenase-like lactoylglutathione lyase family enzyme
MDGKITVITLVVTNQARSLEFFTEKVGFEKKTDVQGAGGSRWVTVAPQGQDLEISLWRWEAPSTPPRRRCRRTGRPGRRRPSFWSCRIVERHTRS